MTDNFLLQIILIGGIFKLSTNDRRCFHDVTWNFKPIKKKQKFTLAVKGVEKIKLKVFQFIKL